MLSVHEWANKEVFLFLGIACYMYLTCELSLNLDISWYRGHLVTHGLRHGISHGRVWISFQVQFCSNTPWASTRSCMCHHFAYVHGLTHGLVHSHVSQFRLLTQLGQMSHGLATRSYDPYFLNFQLSFKLLGLIDCDSVFYYKCDMISNLCIGMLQRYYWFYLVECDLEMT